MRRLVAVALVPSVAVGIDACGSFAASNAVPGEGDAATSAEGAPPPDAPGPEAADSATSPASASLLQGGDFESGCDSWQVYHGTLHPTVPGRDGGQACEVCGDGTDSSWTIFQNTPAGTADVGDRFYGEAWVRAKPDTAAPPTLQVVIFEESDAGTDLSQSGGPLNLAVDATWQRLDARMTVPYDGGSSIQLALEARGSALGCYVVDDIVLRRE